MQKTLLKRTGIFLLSFCVLVILIALQSYKATEVGSDTKNLIKFEFVDPLEKVLAEASYFPFKTAISEVVRGEHATLQFVVRSADKITNLKVNVTHIARRRQLDHISEGRETVKLNQV
jgi:hypothetical protein